MSVLFILIPVTLAMGLVALAAFVWSLRSAQYEDMAGAAERVLLDDDTLPRASAPTKDAARTDVTIEEAPS